MTDRLYFGDERIFAIQAGAPMTAEEREFLVTDTPRFEECTHTEAELRAMSDKDLMSTAYSVWADYTRFM